MNSSTTPRDPVPVPGGDIEASSGQRSARRRIEVAEAVLLAVAALFTAWAAFQSTKWSGVQANNFNSAGASRMESIRESNLANQQAAVDVDIFTSWVDAVATELRLDIDNGFEVGVGTYEPVAGTQSGFLYQRFRTEFRPAFDAWVATKPLGNAAAPGTPFELDEYRLVANDNAAALAERAESFAAIARDANQRSDNYVMMTILFALALVLVGIGSKLDRFSLRVAFAFGSAGALVLGSVVLLTFPVEI